MTDYSGNSLGNGIFNPEIWAREMQHVFERSNVAIQLANTELRSELSVGDTIHKPYRSSLKGQDYAKGVDVTVQDVSGTDEYLLVDTTKVVPFYIDGVDKAQNKWMMMKKFAGDAQHVLNNYLDQTILAEYTNASSDLYNADVGGSGATTTIPVTETNIPSIFTGAAMKLDQLDMPQDRRFAVVGPNFLKTLRLQIQGKDTGAADKIGVSGKVMERFGFELFFSNNLPSSATWTPIDNPTEGATISIFGITLTFNATPSGAGSINIGGTTATTIDNVVACLMETGTAGTDYIALSSTSRRRLNKSNLVATDGTTTLDIVAYGDMAVATSEALDLWSVQIQHMLAGIKGATDLVVQKAPSVEIHQPELKIGKTLLPWQLYGKKTFNNMTDALVDINIDTSLYT